jgi:hypothetical protein
MSYLGRLRELISAGNLQGEFVRRTVARMALVRPLRFFLLRLLPRPILLRALSAATLQQKTVPGKALVLYLERSLFLQDMKQILQRTDELSWCSFPLALLRKLQLEYLPNEAMKQGEYYEKRQDYLSGWREAERLGYDYLRYLAEKREVRAVLAANHDYGSDECIRKACRALEIPYLVLSRENVTDAKIFQHVLELFKRGPSNLAACAVFGPLHKRLYVESGILPEENVWITGSPRMDAYRDGFNPPSIAHRRQIVYMSSMSLYIHNPEQGSLLVDALCRVSERLAGDGGEVILKFKNSPDEKKVDELLPGATDCLRTVSGVTAREALETARVVIGYHTLALLEALLTDVTLVIPFWDGIDTSPERCNLHPSRVEEDCNIFFARSIEEFVDCSVQAFLEPDMNSVNRDYRISLLNKFVKFDPDESASLKVERFVKAYLAYEV